MPGMKRTNYRVGEPIRFDLEPIDDPELSLTLLRDGEEFATYEQLPTVLRGLGSGYYRLMNGEETLVDFAVNLIAPAESDLSDSTTLAADLDELNPTELKQTQASMPLYYGLLLILILALAGSWAFQDLSR